jgi:hypothetical protein
MRLWSLSPSYLDSKGLVTLWREGLLAKAVLEGKTRGYRNHPQLDRFRRADSPLGAINTYLAAVFEEAVNRGYRFDASKIGSERISVKILCTSGQLRYEIDHLAKKLAKRDPGRLALLEKGPIVPHPLFVIHEGEIEKWEKVPLSK